MNNFYTKYMSGNLIGPTRSGFYKNGFVVNNNTTYDGVCPDCNHYGACTQERKDHIYPDPLISYHINNYGYRSDDIDEKYASENFLFSGCSNTFGVGIPYESIWAYQLNKDLDGEKFINLGINSGSYKTIVFDIFSYIRNFGKPKGVFVLFPNMERHIGFTQNKDIFVKVYRNPKGDEDLQKYLDVIPEDVNIFDFYHTVMMLEDYLEKIEVPFIWDTWDEKLNKRILKTQGFKNYGNLNDPEIFHKVDSMEKNLKFDTPYWEIARDLEHFGVKVHVYYSQLFLKAWKDKYEKNN